MTFGYFLDPQGKVGQEKESISRSEAPWPFAVHIHVVAEEEVDPLAEPNLKGLQTYV